ncbi:MAG: hypothetical protein IJS40_03550 [Synergistaceae bacterium]|nr:hypothetical protein [Synergistaceae bacterium]
MLYDIAVPEMYLNELTYESPVELKTGVRVFVEVQRHIHVGFVLGQTKKNLPPELKIKNVEALLDYSPVISPDLWDMALYAGRICMCGTAAALSTILPRPLIMGEKLATSPGIIRTRPQNFREIDNFNPFDSERINFYLDELKANKRTLILFSRKLAAKRFFDFLPENIKSRALLWSSSVGKKYWLSWLKTHAGDFDFVVGTAGAIFAPIIPEKIILEDEASKSFFISYNLNISARSLAGRRAAFLGAEFIIGGRLPSLKTFKRSKPAQKFSPDRKNIILADIFHSKTIKEESKGVEGNIPITRSLLKHTYRELMKGGSVIWILDRVGEASEVFCSHCGESVKCPKCQNLMQVKGDGKILRCRMCGTVRELPPKCEKCGHEILTGRRPGIEALEKMALKYFNRVQLFTNKYVRPKKNSLILSTRRGLDLCDSIDPSLIAWLDLDFELWQPEHDTRLEVFKLLWESYWRGRTEDSQRKVLIQTRRQGMKLAVFLSQGWANFFPNELHRREEFKLPPFGYLIDVETDSPELREKLLDALFDANIFVMDSGEVTEPLRINTESLEPVEKIFQSMSLLRKEFNITVWN